MAASENTSRRDTKIVVSLGILTILATLFTALPGFLYLKTKRSLITYETRTSGIAFPTNSDIVRIKQLLDKEGISDATFNVSLNNSGNQPASDVRISIVVPGKIIAFNSNPSSKDNPPWVDISTSWDLTNNPSTVTYNLKNLAVGPKLKIEVNYSSNGNGDPSCEIYSDGFQATPDAANVTPESDTTLTSIGVFLIGATLSLVVLIILRMKERPELKKLLLLVASDLFPRSFKTAELTSEVIKAAIAKPTNSSFRFEAKNAEKHGNNLKYEDDKEWENIGYWYSTNDYVTWNFTTSRPMRFLVVVEQACIKGCGGKYEVVIGSQRLAANVQETGSWKNFIRCQLGDIGVKNPGQHTLKVQAIQIPGGALMNLRLIILQPID
jgi:hypothetical protein